MNKTEKYALRQNYEEKFANANGIIVAEYRGLSVAELTELRTELKKVDGEFKVCKNRVVKKAIESAFETGEPLNNDLNGPCGLLFLNGDAAAAAKTVLKFGDSHENFVVKAGLFDGQKLDEKNIKAIADLPSKDVLLAKIIGSLVSPHRGLLGVLNGVPRQLVQVINAIKDNKSE